MNKRPAVVEKTRATLIHAFCELYTRKPIENITVQEIVRVTGYNRSTFYQYFTDIYDLRDSIEREVLDCLQAISVSDAKEGGSELCIYHLTKLYDEKGEYLEALFGEYGGVRFTEEVKQVMSVRMKEALPAQVEDRRMDYVQEFVLSSVVSLFRYWIRSGKDVPSEELIPFTRRLITDGAKSEMQELLEVQK